MLVTFGITIFSLIALIKVAELYGKQLKLAPDLDDKRSLTTFKKQLFGREAMGEYNHWKKGVPIWTIFVIRIVLAYIFVIYDLPLLFLFIFIGFLDYIDSQFISLAEENTWVVLDYLVQVLTYTIILSGYFGLLWVEISMVLYVILFFVILADLDFIQLRAFIPDVLAIIAFYGDPVYHVWVFPIAIASFVYNLYYYVLVF